MNVSPSHYGRLGVCGAYGVCSCDVLALMFPSFVGVYRSCSGFDVCVSSSRCPYHFHLRYNTQNRDSADNNTALAARSEATDRKRAERSSIIVAGRAIQGSLLDRSDPQLAAYFRKVSLEPQVYVIRWLRLLFVRELDLSDALVLWDALIADAADMAQHNTPAVKAAVEDDVNDVLNNVGSSKWQRLQPCFQPPSMAPLPTAAIPSVEGIPVVAPAALVEPPPAVVTPNPLEGDDSASPDAADATAAAVATGSLASTDIPVPAAASHVISLPTSAAAAVAIASKHVRLEVSSDAVLHAAQHVSCQIVRPASIDGPGLARHIAVALLAHQRDELMIGDFTSLLAQLMRPARGVDPIAIVQRAYEARSPSSVVRPCVVDAHALVPSESRILYCYLSRVDLCVDGVCLCGKSCYLFSLSFSFSLCVCILYVFVCLCISLSLTVSISHASWSLSSHSPRLQR